MAYYAKKVRWTGGSEKNAVAFRLLKHSGAYFEGVLSKPVLAAFIKAEEAIREGEKDLISGIVFKMETLSGLFECLEADKKLETRIESLFENFFNEPIHRRSKTQITLVQSLLTCVYGSDYQIEGKTLENTKTPYAILRLLKFVTDKPDIRHSKTLPPVQLVTSNL
jgi:hypothetical protein